MKLDTMHNTALRIITGTFKTNPIAAILQKVNTFLIYSYLHKLVCDQIYLIQNLNLYTTKYINASTN